MERDVVLPALSVATAEMVLAPLLSGTLVDQVPPALTEIAEPLTVTDAIPSGPAAVPEICTLGVETVVPFAGELTFNVGPASAAFVSCSTPGCVRACERTCTKTSAPNAGTVWLEKTSSKAWGPANLTTVGAADRVIAPRGFSCGLSGLAAFASAWK